MTYSPVGQDETSYVTNPPSVQTSAVKKSVAINTSKCVRMNSFHMVVVLLSGQVESHDV